MLKNRLRIDILSIIQSLGFSDGDIVCDIPRNFEFGDYTTNIALQLAKLKKGDDKQTARDIANKICQKLQRLEYIEKVTVAGPSDGGGFINIWIKPESLLQNLVKVCNYSTFVEPKFTLGEADKKILIEYASFNALKPVHFGHLRNLILGESLARLVETQGNQVFRVTYTADIGLQIAKTIWGIYQLKKEFDQAQKQDLKEKSLFLGKAYALGANLYEDDQFAKSEIQRINTQIYQKEKKIVSLYQKIVGWSFDYFDDIYARMGTKFDRKFNESEVQESGKKLVLDNVGKIFKEDQGAIIFAGSEHGLHNRVFISSTGNPTYEAKDMALAEAQFKAFPFDLAIHVVANEQDDYFKVIFKALEVLYPKIASRERHLSYGMVNLSTGKMSSRKGNVITFESIYEQTAEKIAEVMKGSQKKNKEQFADGEKDNVIHAVTVGAIKFTMLRYSPQTNFAFDINKSVALSGDSGPYVQYTYSRAKSILRNAAYSYQPAKLEADSFEKEERQILQKIEHFESIVSKAAENYQPNLIANFLLELARLFNLFYQNHKVLDAGEKQQLRLALTCAVAVTLRQGLYLLGIETVERM